MIVFGGSCNECSFNAVCSHLKTLWDGSKYVRVPAICRAMNGITYYHDSDMPEEPTDWYLWQDMFLKRTGEIIIYGREQFILCDSEPTVVVHNVSRVASVKEMASKVLKPGPLKSVYADTTQAQGDLFG